jgi:hypothetical protein
MRHRDRQPGLVGQPLQLGLPQTHARAVAAAAIRRDQDLPGRMVAWVSQLQPPAPNAFHGKGGRVAGDAQIDPARVGGDVVDPIRRHLAEFGNDEIMHPHRLRLTTRTQFAPAIPEVSDKLFLPGVDRDGRLSGGLQGVDERVDMLEPRVAIRVARALAGLAVRLQAEAQATQQAADQLLADAETLLGQRRREMTLALAHPQQGRFGIAADRRLDERG